MRCLTFSKITQQLFNQQQMGKTLKLGFAMGGGVSLGTFSGAALSETIKQAVLNAGYTDETGQFKPYKNIVIDIFSGASAGSMSLAIMLRGLAYQSPAELKRAREKLENDTSINFAGLEKDKQDLVVVAQVVQDLQEDIWINEINIDKLLGTTTEQKTELIFEAGLLRKGALEDISKKYFDLRDAFSTGFEGRMILAERVLFGSTLSNLTGLIFDGNKNNAAARSANYIGATDAFTSRGHKEFRVFDLFFKKQVKNEIRNNPEEFPPKWLRYHLGESENGYLGNICQASTWSRIVATSIACGSFPFAFEPTVLERFRFEYGDEWPKELDQEICTLATGRTDQLSYPFTYIDGGAFNNEPVREAFRMAAFLDAEDTTDFDRVIVFVDPSVKENTVNFRIPVHQQFTVKDPRKFLGVLDGHDVIQKSSLDRLLPHIGSLISMLADEGRLNENNRISYVSELFEKKANYQQIFLTLIDSAIVSADMINELRNQIITCLNAERMNALLPNGSITLFGELTRVVKENPGDLNLDAQMIKEFADNGLEGIDINTYPLLLKGLFYVLLDFLLNLAGKNKNDKIVAIAPIIDNAGVLEVTNLPGSYLQAFSGFTSKRPNIFAASLAKYCSQRLLKELKILSTSFLLPAIPVWKDEDQKAFEQEFKGKLADINTRIDNLFLNASFIDVFAGVDKFILSKLSKAVKDALEEIQLKDAPYYSFSFKIEVPDKSFEIDGRENFNDAEPIKLNGKLFLITELYYYYSRKDKSMCWQGIHEQNGALVIDRDGFAALGDRAFCKIELPSNSQVQKANLLPNPVFTFGPLGDTHRGTTIDHENWKIEPGIKILEKDLLL